MNRAQLVDVNGKKEKPVDGRVIVQKKEDEEDNKWLKKTVQFYSGQPNVTYEVKGKCNTVQLMDSKNCSLEVDTVVSGIEVTNCKEVTLGSKPGKEFWTCTANKCNKLTVNLNDTILNGGAEFLETKQEKTKKEFQLIGAAISDITINRGGKSHSLPVNFQFKLNLTNEPKVDISEFTGKVEATKKGQEMVAEGEGFTIAEGQSKGKTVYVNKKQGKGSKELQLSVQGAANVVVLDECKKVVLTVVDVKKEIQVNNCKQVKITVKQGGKVPKVVLNNTHGCYVTLEELNPDFTFVARHFSDVNMNFPFGGDEDKKEVSLPEQFVYKFDKNNKLFYELPNF